MINHEEPLWGLFSLGCIAATFGIAAIHFIKKPTIILFMLPLQIVFLVSILIGNVDVIYLPVTSLLFFYSAQYLVFKKIKPVVVLLIFGLFSYIMSFVILPQYLLNLQEVKISNNHSLTFTYKSNKGKTTQIPGDRPVILEFWNSGCSNCFKKMYMLDELQKELGDKCDVLCVYVDYKKGVEEHYPKYQKSLLRIAGKYSLNFTYDSLYYHYDSKMGLPQTIIVSKDGRVLYSDAGYITGNKKAIMNKYKSVIDEYID